MSSGKIIDKFKKKYKHLWNKLMVNSETSFKMDTFWTLRLFYAIQKYQKNS